MHVKSNARSPLPHAHTANFYHYGGELSFGADKTLYFAMGDLGTWSANPTTTLTGVLRFNRDGALGFLA